MRHQPGAPVDEVACDGFFQRDWVTGGDGVQHGAMVRAAAVLEELQRRLEGA